jgi:hypothetical protein
MLQNVQDVGSWFFVLIIGIKDEYAYWELFECVDCAVCAQSWSSYSRARDSLSWIILSPR